MSLSQPHLNAIFTAYSFSTAMNIFLIINLYTLYHGPVPAPSSRTKRKIFLAFAITHLLFAIASQATFLTLFVLHRGVWSTIVLSSVILMNMCREVNQALNLRDKANDDKCIWAVNSWSPGQRAFFPLFLAVILIISSICFLAGAILGGNYPLLGRNLISGSVISYRLWMVWEWAQFAAYAMTGRKNILFHLMAQTLAFGASAAGTFSESRANHLLIISNVFAIHGLIVCASPVIKRWKRSFQRARRVTAEGLSADSSTDVILADLNLTA